MPLHILAALALSPFWSSADALCSDVPALQAAPAAALGDAVQARDELVQ